jgi:hypothetical protein
MRLWVPHTLSAVFLDCILGLVVYFLLIRFMCGFLAVGKRADELASRLHERYASNPEMELANSGLPKKISPSSVELLEHVEIPVESARSC